MKIDVNPINNQLRLREVYNGIKLVTNNNEELDIAMRDTGFEFTYMGENYEAKKGKVRKLNNENSNDIESGEFGVYVEGIKEPLESNLYLQNAIKKAVKLNVKQIRINESPKYYVESLNSENDKNLYGIYEKETTKLYEICYGDLKTTFYRMVQLNDNYNKTDYYINKLKNSIFRIPPSISNKNKKLENDYFYLENKIEEDKKTFKNNLKEGEWVWRNEKNYANKIKSINDDMITFYFYDKLNSLNLSNETSLMFSDITRYATNDEIEERLNNEMYKLKNKSK